jgi:ubiquinone/menaquinone biosynthesis C-methylase UbiE
MTNRRHLTTAAYGSSANLSARQAIYTYQEPAIDFPAWALALTPIGERATVLDVGCGNGVYLRRLAARPVPPARLLGLDLSRGMLADLRREWDAALPPPRLAAADLQALPLPDTYCDVALAMHMLFHVPDLARGLAELRRVLRPGGVLLAATNGADHLRELGDLIDAAMTNVAGRPVALPRVSGLQFGLENGAETLRVVFASVERRDARSALVIPTPEPVVRYTASLATAREALPDGTDWAAVLTEVERLTAARIAAHGAFRVTTQAGVFVCA